MSYFNKKVQFIHIIILHSTVVHVAGDGDKVVMTETKDESRGGVCESGGVADHNAALCGNFVERQG